MIINHKKIELGKTTLIEKVTIRPPFRLSFSFPDEACFIYFDTGSTTINAPYEQKEVSSKEAVLLRCGTYFSELLTDLKLKTYDILVFHLPKDVLREIYKEHFPVSGLSGEETFIRKVNSSLILEKFIQGLEFYFTNPKVVTDELLTLKIQELILLLRQTGNVNTLKELFNDTFSQVEADLKKVVYSHLFSGLSVNDLASLCNMSPSTFNRKFKTIFDDTPSNFLKNKRLDKAKELLQDSRLSIGEIAFKTCFYDSSHLSKAFKKRFGSVPTEYREDS